MTIASVQRGGSIISIVQKIAEGRRSLHGDCDHQQWEKLGGGSGITRSRGLDPLLKIVVALVHVVAPLPSAAALLTAVESILQSCPFDFRGEIGRGFYSSKLHCQASLFILKSYFPSSLQVGLHFPGPFQEQRRPPFHVSPLLPLSRSH